MGVEVQFINNSVRIKKALNDKGIAWLYDACGELMSQTIRNSAVGKIGGGKTKDSYQYKVNEDKLEGYVGSNYENAIWEEFGTGEYALNKDGRKGGWWILLDAGGMTEAQAKAYGFTIRKGKNGKKYAFTRGKKPKRPLFKAFTALKSKLIQRAQKIFGGV